MKRLIVFVGALIVLVPIDIWAIRERIRMEHYESLVWRGARLSGVPPALICAVIETESGWRPDVVSSKGTVGLMQLRPDTAARIALRYQIGSYSLSDPCDNITLGSLYLAGLLKEFQGDVTLALASYNAGPQAVEKWLLRDPQVHSSSLVSRYACGETRTYVRRALENLDRWRTAFPVPPDTASR